MDNNNYEQSFIRNVNQTAHSPSRAPQTNTSNTPNPSRLPLVVATVLAFIVLIESIVLAIFAVNYFSPSSDTEEVFTTVSDDSPEALSEGTSFTFNDDYVITAFNLKCTTENGVSYTFSKAGDYQKTDASSNQVEDGAYSIVNGSAVILKNPASGSEDKIVYYDGYNIIDNLTFYSCEEI